MATQATPSVDTDFLGSEFVTIYVGPNRKSFKIHKRLLCERSSYFSKTFEGGFKESFENETSLPEDDETAFGCLVNWFYRDKLPSPLSRGFQDDKTSWGNFFDQILIPLYAMAEKFCIDELCNKIVDAIQDSDLKHCVIPGYESMEMIYSSTHEESHLRKYCALMLLRKIFQYRIDDKGRHDLVDHLLPIVESHPDLSADIGKFLIKYGHQFFGRKVPDAQLRMGELSFGRCYFHTHSKGEVCYLEATKTKK